MSVDFADARADNCYLCGRPVADLGHALHIDGELRTLCGDSCRAVIESDLDGADRGATPATATPPRRRLHTLALVAGLPLLSAAITLLCWHWLNPARAWATALAVLLIGNFHALAAALPRTLAGARRVLARAQVPSTGDGDLRQLAATTDIVFEQTTALDTAPRVGTTISCSHRSPEVCRDIANTLAAGLEQPAARAFGANDATFPAENRRELGEGIEGWIAGRCYRLGESKFVLELSRGKMMLPYRQGHWLLLGDRSGALCWFGLDDGPAAATVATLARLNQRGVKLHLLVSEQTERVDRLAKQLNFNRVAVCTTPAQIRNYADSQSRHGGNVLRVAGDATRLSVTAADLTVEIDRTAAGPADPAAPRNRLARLPALLGLAQQTRRIARQNLGLALGYNALAIPLAAAGLIPPLLALFGIPLSSLLLYANTRRLRFAAATP